MEQRPYDYEFTPLAKQDIEEIFEYISYTLGSPQAADNLIDKIQEAVEKVCEFPYLRPLLTEKVLRDKGYRMIAVKNFSLFYTARDGTIIIHRVLYGRRNYENLL